MNRCLGISLIISNTLLFLIPLTINFSTKIFLNPLCLKVSFTLIVLHIINLYFRRNVVKIKQKKQLNNCISTFKNTHLLVNISNVNFYILFLFLFLFSCEKDPDTQEIPSYINVSNIEFIDFIRSRI